MSDSSTSGDTSDTTDASHLDQLAADLDQAQGLAQSLQQDLPPFLAEEAEHLEADITILETWTADSDDEGVDALAGAPTVVTTAQTRVDYLQDELGAGDTGIQERLDQLDATLQDIEDHINSLEITATAYVTYVNREFADRYVDASVRIATILTAAGREDVDELGLYPLDGLYGSAIPDLAFPADREVDLREDNRTYWQSESDGGCIA